MFGLTFYACSLPLSKAGISLGIFILLISLLISGNFISKWKKLVQIRTPLVLASVFFIFMLGLLGTDHREEASREILRALYWIAFPIILASSPILSSKEKYQIGFFFIMALCASALVILIRMFLLDEHISRNFRSLAMVDHIPLSYQFAFGFWIMMYGFAKKIWDSKPVWIKWAAICTSVYILVVFILLKSLTGYVFFMAMGISSLVFLVWDFKNRNLKLFFLAVLLFLIGAPVYYVNEHIRQFYSVDRVHPEHIDLKTSAGNPYRHDFDDSMKENGHFVYLYICEKELRDAWNERARIPYNSFMSGSDSLKYIIFRYMTSKGLRKDADGFRQLSDTDIRNIENGICNIIYDGSGLGVDARIYETIWELDQYLNGKTAKDKSLAQRIEMFRLSIEAIRKRPWLGYGLGDQQQAYAEIAESARARMPVDQLGSAHNQYLSQLLRFGIVGSLAFFGTLMYVMVKAVGFKNYFLNGLVAGYFAANFGESNFDTFIGINFFGLTFSLLCWNMLDRDSDSVHPGHSNS